PTRRSSDLGRVRITDFGIAVTAGDTEPHVMIGTLGYMAPEQLTADSPMSERTDVYALGQVLYELVTGQPHHTSRSEDASRLSLLAPGIDRQFERAILKAINRDPRDRPATANEMAAALPALDAGERSGR